MRIAVRILLVSLFFASLLVSCEFWSGGVDIVVEVPELPEFLRSRIRLDSLRIDFLSSDRSVLSSIVEPDQRLVAVSIPKLGIVPVLVTPVLDMASTGSLAGTPEASIRSACGLSCDRLVAGGFFPASQRGDTMKLSWEDGPIANFLLDYLSRFGDECWFNLQKLLDEALEATSGNPWNIDFETLAVGFECRSLSHSIIREARSFVLDDLLPEGAWYEIDPLNGERIEWEITAFPGSHLYVDGMSGFIAELFVGKDIWSFVLNRDPETALSGIW